MGDPAIIDGGAFDHVILATLDAEATAARLRRDFRLGAIRGGSHPWGTANLIVPLEPPTYLEILYPEHPDRLVEDPEGKELLDRMRRGEFWAGWALRPAAIEDLAQRLDLDVEVGQATRPDGSVSSWRSAAPKADIDGSLPFLSITTTQPTGSSDSQRATRRRAMSGGSARSLGSRSSLNRKPTGHGSLTDSRQTSRSGLSWVLRRASAPWASTWMIR